MGRLSTCDTGVGDRCARGFPGDQQHEARRAATLNVTFYGVRGSTPSCEMGVQRYGGNTSCVVLERPGVAPIILDLGTGLRFFGRTHDHTTPFEGTALVSHLHWDHVQGLPFFSPVLAEGARLEIVAPATDHEGGGLDADSAIRTFLGPPFFPVSLDALRGDITVRSTPEGPFSVGDARVTSAEVPHCGRTLGYRIDVAGMSIGYVPDHQQPGPDATEVAPGVLELVRDVDLLIHDAQFDAADFAAKSDWGHCTVEYAVHVAAQAGARRLALFHHDPSHDDESIDALTAAARLLGNELGVEETFAAAEGLTVAMEAPKPVEPAPRPVDAAAPTLLIDG